MVRPTHLAATAGRHRSPLLPRGRAPPRAVRPPKHHHLFGGTHVKALAFATATALAVALLLASPTLADPDGNHGTQGLTDPVLLALITNDDLFSIADLTALLDPPGPNGTQHYGPYTSTSPDSGTCGNDWATDTFDRHFTVRNNPDGTFTVVQQFKNGSFLTNAGFSPGSCDFSDGSPPGTVNAGVAGSMHGYFIIPLPPGTTQSSTSTYCDANAMTNTGCTTTTFINTHFSPACYPATCPVTTFFFHYSAGGQSLVEHEWKNASSDRGGNHGDVRSTNT
jgi:hypothetical protein